MQEISEVWLDFHDGYARVGVEEQSNVGETGVGDEVGMGGFEAWSLQRRRLCNVVCIETQCLELTN